MIRMNVKSRWNIFTINLIKETKLLTKRSEQDNKNIILLTNTAIKHSKVANKINRNWKYMFSLIKPVLFWSLTAVNINCKTNP